MSISIDKKRAGYLSRAMSVLSKEAASLGGICILSACDERAVLSVACEENQKNRLKSKLYDSIVRIYCDDFKQEYIKQNIKSLIANPINFGAFVRALVAFDSEFDEEIIRSALAFKSCIDLDSFYHFRLKDLKKRWKEVCELAGDNAFYLGFGDTFLELMRFLISTIECKSHEIIIESKGEGFNIFDCDRMETTFALEESLVPSIINLSPRVISIYEGTKIPNQIMNLICSLYEKKVNTLKVKE